MESTSNASRPHDTRTPPGTEHAGSTPVDALSSWDGPGTAYTLAPRPAVPAPISAQPSVQSAPQEPPEALPAPHSSLPTPGPLVNWLLIVGVAVCVLLVALWKAGTFDNPIAAPTDHEASPPPPVQTQPADNPLESTVTVTQEPMDDELEQAPSSAPVVDELPDPAAHDHQLPSDANTIRPAAPDAQNVEKPAPAPAPATAPSPAKVSAQKPAEHRQPKPTTPAIAAQKVRPLPTDAVVITGTRPASPTRPRSTPAPATVGTLIVAVQPWAEIWIDGRKRGISPPLFKLQLPPGVYTVELRNPDLPGYSQKVQIVTGQSVTLRHSFQ